MGIRIALTRVRAARPPARARRQGLADRRGGDGAAGDDARRPPLRARARAARAGHADEQHGGGGRGLHQARRGRLRGRGRAAADRDRVRRRRARAAARDQARAATERRRRRAARRTSPRAGCRPRCGRSPGATTSTSCCAEHNRSRTRRWTARSSSTSTSCARRGRCARCGSAASRTGWCRRCRSTCSPTRARFVRTLRGLRSAWRSALDQVPRLQPDSADEERLVEILRMQPVSVGVRGAAGRGPRDVRARRRARRRSSSRP